MQHSRGVGWTAISVLLAHLPDWLGDPDPQTNPWDAVHFRNKAPLGPRLAAVARDLVYGLDDGAAPRWMGPVAIDARAEEGQVRGGSTGRRGTYRRGGSSC